MDKFRDIIARVVNGVANTIAPNPVKAARKKQLKEIEKVLDEMDWQVVIVKRDDYYKMAGIKDPLLNPTSGTKMSISELNDDARIKQIMQEMGFDNFYFEDGGYYGEEDLATMPNGFPPISKPNNDSAIMMPGTDDIPPDMLDSVYNFAVFYIYGSKKNNIVTMYSVDKDDRLFCHDQMQFNVKNYTDVIDVCDRVIEKFDLDSITFVNTEVGKKLIYFVEKGIKNQEVSVETVRESVDYTNDINALVPLLGIGQIFVSMGPWLEKFQMELNTHMMMPPHVRGKEILKRFHRLKAFVNGVKYWEEGIENDRFVRDLGLSEQINAIVNTDGNEQN